MAWPPGCALAVVAGATAYAIGNSYEVRLSHPRPGPLVAVDDVVREPFERPRRTYVVVADGLRLDAALTMKSVARLWAEGSCHPTDVGPITISRAVYGALSTGVVPDRTVVRDNSVHGALAVESVWEVARHAGLTVIGRSVEPWWQELFPGGFDRYSAGDVSFATEGAGDLTLIHPGWIDDEGHARGAASPAYAAAVRRVDGELMRLLDEIDLRRDLIVFTSDHGHTATGGHGGRTPEVAAVLTCLAGRGVARGVEPRPLLATDLGPALALLMGLPFPRHMRAGADHLDALWGLCSLPERYLTERQRAVARFRAANPPWRDVYEAARRDQALRMAIVAGLAAALAYAVGRGRATLLFIAATVAAGIVVHMWVFGGFDFSVLNDRPRYTRAVAVMLGAVVGMAFGIRWLAGRRSAHRDLAALVAAGTVANVGLVWIFGAPLDMPLPSAAWLFAPVYAAEVTLVAALLLGLVAVILPRHARVAHRDRDRDAGVRRH